MINKIIKESIKVGIPIRCEYILNRGFVYEVTGFYKSDIISIEEQDGFLIASCRYGKKTQINEPKDIVQLNYEWWNYSKDRFDGWAYPSITWKKLFEKFDISTS